MSIRYFIDLHKFRKAWREENGHNKTTAVNIFNKKLVSVGIGTYGPLNINRGNNKSKITIGNYCSIAAGVSFIIDNDHPTNNISTYPFKALIAKNGSEAISKGDIVIGDDVWIGQNAMILSGVHIGQGAVIGAGGVVTKNIPPYAIAVGVPAKVIKYRFKQEIIDELLRVDYSKLDKDCILKHMKKLYEPLENIEQLEWLPKK